MATDRTNLTGPQHVELALQLADLAEQRTWEEGEPSDEQRYRMLMRAHLHANLARTAAMVDGRRFDDGSVRQSADVRRAWHEVFAVKP